MNLLLIKSVEAFSWSSAASILRRKTNKLGYIPGKKYVQGDVHIGIRVLLSGFWVDRLNLLCLWEVAISACFYCLGRKW